MPQWMHYVFVDVIDPRLARRSVPTGVALIVKQPVGPTGHPLCILKSLDRSKMVKWLTDQEYDLDAHPIRKRFYSIIDLGDEVGAVHVRPRARRRS